MINETYKAMLGGKSIIRELSEYATKRGEKIGYDNVFDYSLGNPSVPCAEDYTKAIIDMHETMNPMELHGYSPSTTIPSVRKAVAESLNRRFGMQYGMEHIFMTSGAAGALAHALRAVTKPGDTVLTFAPFFPEYTPYVEGTGAKLEVVPAHTKDFQINFEAFEEMLTGDVMAVLINTAMVNNPWLKSTPNMEAKNSFNRSGGDTCSRLVKIEAIQNKIAAPITRISTIMKGVMMLVISTIFEMGDINPHIILAVVMDKWPFNSSFFIFLYSFCGYKSR